jgi:hypothetical protein
MGIFGNLFKSDTQSEEEVKNSELVLERLKQRRGQETGKWLNLMRDPKAAIKAGPPPTIEDIDLQDSVKEAPYTPPIESQYTTLAPGQSGVTTAAKQGDVPKGELVEWVGKLFNEFARQAAEFNASATGTKLVVTVRNPVFTYEAPRYGEYQAEKKVGMFKGHLATQIWAMWIQGYDDKTDVYVIPAEMVLKFTLDDIRKSDLTPFMTIDSKPGASGREWSIEGTVIPADSIEPLATELLGDLVRIATGQMDEAELFGNHSAGLKLGQNVAQGYVNAPAEPGATGAGAPQAAGPPPTSGGRPPAKTLENLATWPAAQQLMKAIDEDILWLNEQEGLLDPSEKDLMEKVHVVSGKLRTLAGQVSGLVADNQPRAGSKYNAS